MKCPMNASSSVVILVRIRERSSCTSVFGARSPAIVPSGMRKRGRAKQSVFWPSAVRRGSTLI